MESGTEICCLVSGFANNQTGYPPEVYQQVNKIGIKAWKSLPNKGEVSGNLTKILQSPTEPFSDFVARLVEAAGRIFGDPHTAMPLIKQLVYEQCTKECRAAITPYKSKGLEVWMKQFPSLKCIHYMDDILLAAKRHQLLDEAYCMVVKMLAARNLFIAPEKVELLIVIEVSKACPFPFNLISDSCYVVNAVNSLECAGPIKSSSTTLKSKFAISRADAHKVVLDCQHCVQFHHPPSIGVNLRGLLPLRVWQMDVTHISESGRLKYVHVSVDTCSGVMFASPMTEEKSSNVITHCLEAWAAWGKPQQLKTDNGPAYSGQKFESFCAQMDVQLVHGLPYNPQGQGKAEGQNLKSSSIMQKGQSSVLHLEPLRGYRAGKDNSFLILSSFHLHHHLAKRTLNNLCQENSNMQNSRYFQILGNRSRECNDLKYRLDSLNRTLDRSYKENKVGLDSKQHRGKHVEGYWFCYGIKCYYFIIKEKPWSGCTKTCKDRSLSFLKIEDSNELQLPQYLQRAVQCRALKMAPVSAFCLPVGKAEGQNLKSSSIMQKGQSSVLHLEPLRGYRAGKDNSFLILSSFHLHHHLAKPSEMSEERSTYAELTLSLKSKKDKNHPIKEKRDCSWRMAAMILGVVCLCLLMSKAVVVYLCEYDLCYFYGMHEIKIMSQLPKL
ncbi:hypothetical protein STEG23_036930, partial [Scotinomys teguina]